MSPALPVVVPMMSAVPILQKYLFVDQIQGKRASAPTETGKGTSKAVPASKRASIAPGFAVTN